MNTLNYYTVLRLIKQIIVAATVGLLATATPVLAADEYALKAALIYNFIKQIEWPTTAFAGNGEPLRVCELGGNQISNGITAISQKSPLASRSISVITATQADLPSCHVLILGAIDDNAQRQIDRVTKTKPILVIADNYDRLAAENLAVITLIERDSRIGFNINLHKAEQHQLTIGVRLLNLATQITR